MNVRDVGDRVTIFYRALDPTSGALVDATVTVAVTDPSGAVTSPSVTHVSLGVYSAFFDLNAVGPWRWKWTAAGTIVDVSYGEVDAQNPAPQMYVTLEEFKLSFTIGDDTKNSDVLSKLVSAQKKVENDTGRRFWVDAVASQRIYKPRHQELLAVDDISTSSGVIVETGTPGGSWSVLDPVSYEFQTGDSLNSLADGWPIEYINRVSGFWQLSSRYLGIGRPQRVRVTAIWGWPTVPESIKTATMLKAARLFRRKDSPEGIRGFSDFGVVRVTRYDPDYDGLINDYVKGGV